MTDMNLDELDELEDDEDESVLLEYRRKRIAEMQAAASKSRFGDVREISGQDYVSEVNKAGDGIWVVLHLYKQGIPLCALLNRFMNDLAQRYPQTKFLKSIASTCIPNFPEANLPSIFIYYEGDLKKQVIGSVELRGEKITAEEFEYIIGRYGAIETDIKEDPRTTVKDKMLSDLSDTNDWWSLVNDETPMNKHILFCFENVTFKYLLAITFFITNLFIRILLCLPHYVGNAFLNILFCCHEYLFDYNFETMTCCILIDVYEDLVQQ